MTTITDSKEILIDFILDYEAILNTKGLAVPVPSREDLSQWDEISLRRLKAELKELARTPTT
jgi:hypothetical protein